MPGMDGFEVCERLKANPATVHIPAVMVTALTDATDRVRGLEAGADDFLSKPVNDTALMARVRSLVRLKMIVDEWQVREKPQTSLAPWTVIKPLWPSRLKMPIFWWWKTTRWKAAKWWRPWSATMQSRCRPAG